eukprot:5231860-Amphidinium_carterae.1
MRRKRFQHQYSMLVQAVACRTRMHMLSLARTHTHKSSLWQLLAASTKWWSTAANYSSTHPQSQSTIALFTPWGLAPALQQGTC